MKNYCTFDENKKIMPSLFRSGSGGGTHMTKWDETFIKFCIWFPAWASIMGVITILTPHSIALSEGHYPGWMVFPFISLAGCRQPEKTAFKILFCILAAHIFIFTYIVSITIVPIFSHYRCANGTIVLVFFGGVALICTGLFTLQSDFIDEIAEDKYRFQKQSVLHLISATVLFFTGFAFLAAINYLYAYSRHPVISRLRYSRKFKMCSLILPVAYQGAVTIWMLGVSPPYRLAINIMGLGEWISCFCLFLCVATFSVDVYHLSKSSEYQVYLESSEI